MSKGDVKRFEPMKATLRQLFAFSGNLCAFPNCKNYLLNEKGVFVGQVCHIEGVKGERFNPKMTNEERRHPSNLVLMCYEHHQETNDEKVWTVEKMRSLKEAHEARFRNPEKAILAGLKDWTKADTLVLPKNLKKFIKILDLPFEGEEEESFFNELVKELSRLQAVPVEVRAFLGRVIERMHNTEQNNLRLMKSNSRALCIPAADIQKAFGLSQSKLAKHGKDLERYKLGDIEEGFDEHEVRIFHIQGAPFWYDLLEFSLMTNTDFEGFYGDLDFSALQS
jgi:hypothetical protein